MAKWQNKITIPFAQNGDKKVIPDTSLDRFVNLTDGWTTDYSVNPKDGGKYLERENFNSLQNSNDVRIKELQEKTITSINGLDPDEEGDIDLLKVGNVANFIDNEKFFNEIMGGVNGINTDAFIQKLYTVFNTKGGLEVTTIMKKENITDLPGGEALYFARIIYYSLSSDRYYVIINLKSVINGSEYQYVKTPDIGGALKQIYTKDSLLNYNILPIKNYYKDGFLIDNQEKFDEWVNAEAADNYEVSKYKKVTIIAIENGYNLDKLINLTNKTKIIQGVGMPIISTSNKNLKLFKYDSLPTGTGFIIKSININIIMDLKEDDTAESWGLQYFKGTEVGESNIPNIIIQNIPIFTNNTIRININTGTFYLDRGRPVPSNKRLQNMAIVFFQDCLEIFDNLLIIDNYRLQYMQYSENLFPPTTVGALAPLCLIKKAEITNNNTISIDNFMLKQLYGATDEMASSLIVQSNKSHNNSFNISKNINDSSLPSTGNFNVFYSSKCVTNNYLRLPNISYFLNNRYLFFLSYSNKEKQTDSTGVIATNEPADTPTGGFNVVKNY